MEPLRFSVLKQMAKSPAHAKWAMEHPSPQTPAMRFGSLSHAIFLGAGVPTVFRGERRGNVWKDFKLAHEGEEIVTEEEFERAAAMAAALHSHRDARTLLMGTRERTVLFDWAGRPCRATPDVFSKDCLTELKTTTDASPERFPFIARRLSYASQLAFYKDALEIAGIAKPSVVSVVAIEVKPPHAVCVFSVTDDALEYGRRLYRTWMEQFLLAEKSNDWPGYPLGVLEAPPEDFTLVGADGEEIEID